MHSQFCESFYLKFEKVLIFWVILVQVVVSENAYMLNNNPYHRRVELDPDGKYRLEWLTDWTEKSITFNVTAETRGYIFFGISSKGEIAGADIVIGGVKPNGETYFSDRHTVGNQFPEVDASQDWKLLEAWENSTHTFLSFSRPFDTCDPQDYPITENKISLIWAYGERDDVFEYRHQNKGKYDVYLITPDYTPPILRDEKGALKKVLGNPELDNLKTWTIPTKLEIPSKDTTYWCTVQTPPKLAQKHHIIGAETRFPSEHSQGYVHHFTLRKCHLPPEFDPLAYLPFLTYSGNLCNLEGLGETDISTQFCTEWTWTWAIGGKTFFLPPEVGIPIGGSPNEFFITQVHYNNPNKLSNITVEATFDFFYTSNLRPNDGGILLVGQQVPGLPPSILIPPESGITISAGMLHAHNSAVAIRFQHFRNSQELPWILADANYNNAFQQFLVTRQAAQVLPGDQLTLQCTYDNTWTNTSVVGGLSTREEMCAVFAFYYTKLKNHGSCLSELVTEEYREYFLGVTNISWSPSYLQYAADAPHPLAGYPMTQLSDTRDWTSEKRVELQKFHLTHPQANFCPRLVPEAVIAVIRKDNNNGTAASFPMATYPLNAQPYTPEMMCSNKTGLNIPGNYVFNRLLKDSTSNNAISSTIPNSNYYFMSLCLCLFQYCHILIGK